MHVSSRAWTRRDGRWKRLPFLEFEFREKRDPPTTFHCEFGTDAPRVVAIELGRGLTPENGGRPTRVRLTPQQQARAIQRIPEQATHLRELWRLDYARLVSRQAAARRADLEESHIYQEWTPAFRDEVLAAWDRVLASGATAKKRALADELGGYTPSHAGRLLRRALADD